MPVWLQRDLSEKTENPTRLSQNTSGFKEGREGGRVLRPPTLSPVWVWPGFSSIVDVKTLLVICTAPRLSQPLVQPLAEEEGQVDKDVGKLGQGQDGYANEETQCPADVGEKIHELSAKRR